MILKTSISEYIKIVHLFSPVLVKQQILREECMTTEQTCSDIAPVFPQLPVVCVLGKSVSLSRSLITRRVLFHDFEHAQTFWHAQHPLAANSTVQMHIVCMHLFCFEPHYSSFWCPSFTDQKIQWSLRSYLFSQCHSSFYRSYYTTRQQTFTGCRLLRFVVTCRVEVILQLQSSLFLFLLSTFKIRKVRVFVLFCVTSL